MDTPIWVTILVGVAAAAATWRAGVVPARIAAKEAQDDRQLAWKERQDQREQWFMEHIKSTWDLCRNGTTEDRVAGRGMLRALIKEPDLSRLVSNMLDEAVQSELGEELRTLRNRYIQYGALPDVDIIVVEDDVDGEGEEDHG